MQTVEQLNAALLGKLAEDKLLRGRKLRVDTTVIEADIDHPTDADLLEHGARKLGRLVRRIKAAGSARRTRFRDRSRSAGRRLKEISRTLRRRTGQAMSEIDWLTGEIATVARATLREVTAVERNARRALRERPMGRLARAVSELAEAMAGTRRLLEQTALRLAGVRLIPDRIVSLADADARPICKGKPQHPTQFGYTALVAEEERGFVVDHQVQRGNPPDAPQLVPAVERVTTLTGRTPATVVADRGFGTAANDRALAELGVRRIGLQRAGTPGKARPRVRTHSAVPAHAQLESRHRGPHQPPQTQLRTLPHPPPPPDRRTDLDRTRDLRPQPCTRPDGRVVNRQRSVV